jgi:small nuclear ribonucleoprotein (snRNP)-like protein
MFSIEQEHKFLKTLLTASLALEGTYDEIFLAGGACRDSLLNKFIKDYDVFVLNPSKTLQNKLKKHAEKASTYTLGTPVKPDEVVPSFDVWNLNEEIQLILVNGKSIDGVLNTFDYDFNQIAFTHEAVHSTVKFEDFYMQDDEINFVTLTNNTFEEAVKKSQNKDRLVRFVTKYDNYSFKDIEGNVVDDEFKTKYFPAKKSSHYLKAYTANVQDNQANRQRNQRMVAEILAEIDNEPRQEAGINLGALFANAAQAVPPRPRRAMRWEPVQQEPVNNAQEVALENMNRIANQLRGAR